MRCNQDLRSGHKAAYAHKDLLRTRKYKWDTHPIDNFKAWSIELSEHQVEAEIKYLKTEIYNWKMNIPVDIFDAYSRFSVLDNKHKSHDYTEQLYWMKSLQNG